VENVGKREDLAYWDVPVTKSLDMAVEEAVRRDMHNTKADLIRDAVREKLKEMGFTISAISPLT
jgi:Arc/MetJ-type ribon-helix-helix transcriptional regulator